MLLTCRQELVHWKCDFSHLGWPTQEREEESCARVDQQVVAGFDGPLSPVRLKARPAELRRFR